MFYCVLDTCLKWVLLPVNLSSVTCCHLRFRRVLALHTPATSSRLTVPDTCGAAGVLWTRLTTSSVCTSPGWMVRLHAVLKHSRCVSSVAVGVSPLLFLYGSKIACVCEEWPLQGKESVSFVWIVRGSQVKGPPAKNYFHSNSVLVLNNDTGLCVTILKFDFTFSV